MGIVEVLTPKDTEEIKPGLFIQRWSGGWRQVHPASWDGKINYKNLIFGGSILKPLAIFVILMLLSYGYYESTKSCEEFQQDPCKHLTNITNYCMGNDNQISGFGVNSEYKTNNNTLQSYP